MAVFQNAHQPQAKSANREDVAAQMGPVSNSGRAKQAQATREKRARKSGAKHGAQTNASPVLATPVSLSSDSLRIAARPGSSAVAEVRVTANEDCVLDALALSDAKVFSILRPTEKVTLKAGETAAIAVEFSPRVKGEVSGNIELSIETGTGVLTLEQKMSVALKGLGGKYEAGNGDVRVDIRGDVGNTPKGKPRKKPVGRVVEKEPDSTQVEVIDTRGYTTDDLVERCLEKMLAAMTKLDGALEIFQTVVATPSKSEAARASAGAIAFGRVGDLLIRLAAKPLLSRLPGGGPLFEVLKAGLKASKDLKNARKRAKDARAANSLKDFTTAYRAQVTETRASLEASQKEVVVGFRRELAGVSGELRENRRLELYAEGNRLETALAGELSVTGLFTKIVGEWMRNSPPSRADSPNRLIIDLRENWSLMDGWLLGPTASRCAEQLMGMHGGTLNVAMLGLPVQVRWFLEGEKGRRQPVRSFVNAWIAPDGTVQSVNAPLVTNSSAAADRMKELLASKGIPEVTRLAGTGTYP